MVATKFKEEIKSRVQKKMNEDLQFDLGWSIYFLISSGQCSKGPLSVILAAVLGQHGGPMGELIPKVAC